jgi:hypothetical protein
MIEKPVDPKSQIFDLTLMSNFVHQVVNPLNAVCGTLDNIIRGDVPSGSVNQRIRASRSQIEYCIELIRNLAFLAEYQRDPEGYEESRNRNHGRAANPHRRCTVLSGNCSKEKNEDSSH